MATKQGDVDMTDEEIEALVAAVSEEMGTLPDDIDFDINTEADIILVTDTEEQEVGRKLTEERIVPPDEQSTIREKVDEVVTTTIDVCTQPKSEIETEKTEFLASVSVGQSESETLTDKAPLNESKTPLSAAAGNEGSISETISKEPTQPTQTVSVPQSPKENLNKDEIVKPSTQDNKKSDLKATAQSRAEGVVTQQISQLPPQPTMGQEHIAAADAADADLQSQKHDQKDKRSAGSSWGWNSFGSWGSSVISSASSFTSQVGESLYHVLETVESTLIEPEEGSSVPTAADQIQISEEGKNLTGIEDCNKATAHGKQNSMEGNICEASGTDVSPDAVKEPPSEASSVRDKNVDHSATGNVSELCKVSTGSEVVETTSRQLPGDVDQRQDSGEHGASWLMGWDLSGLSHLTGTVKTTGKKVVSTGWGVIGTIGKKTYNVLMEDDDDAQSAEGAQHSSSEKHLQSSLFSTVQDDTGVAHLEALEELSKWSKDSLNKQLSTLRGNYVRTLHDDLALIEESFNLGDLLEVDVDGKEHDFSQLLTDYVNQLGFSLNTNKLLTVHKATRDWLCEQQNQQPLLPLELHQVATQRFNEFTTASIALYHKVGQLLLIEHSIPLLSYKFRALSLAGLTKVLCMEVFIQSHHFSHLLTSPNMDGSVMSDTALSAATSIELEASNGCSCICDACSYLLPIMQLAILRIHPLLTDYSGIAHLESLQVLSGMSQTNVRDAVARLDREVRHSIETELNSIESAIDLGYLQNEDGDDTDEHDDAVFGRKILDLGSQLASGLESAKRLVETQQRVRKYLSDCRRDLNAGHLSIATNDVHQMAVQALNNLTNCSIDVFYHIGQSMLLEKPKDIQQYAKHAGTLATLAKLLCLEVGYQSTQFTHCLSSAAGSAPDSVTPLVTNVYLEASSSSSYIKDGLQLLLPVVQLALIKAHPLCAEFLSGTR